MQSAGGWLAIDLNIQSFGLVGLDFLTMDYLAEVALSVLTKQMRRNPDAGYAYDFIEVLDRIGVEPGAFLSGVWSAGVAPDSGGSETPRDPGEVGER